MRDISIIGTGGSGDNTGVYNEGYSSPSMVNVSINIGGTAEVYGVFNLTYSSPVMTMVTAIVSGGTHRYGLYNEWYCSPSVNHFTVDSSTYGVYNMTHSSTDHQGFLHQRFGLGYRQRNRHDGKNGEQYAQRRQDRLGIYLCRGV